MEAEDKEELVRSLVIDAQSSKYVVMSAEVRVYVEEEYPDWQKQFDETLCKIRKNRSPRVRRKEKIMRRAFV